MSNLVYCVAFLFALMPNLAHAEKMTFREAWTGGNCSTCAWVAAEGEITSQTPEDFERFISEFGPVRDLVINSPGGDLMAGIALGQIVRRQGINTIVGATITEEFSEYPKSGIDKGYCYSACSYVFFGGVDRHVDAGDLGVHQFYVKDGIDTSSSDTQSIIGITLVYLKEMGISSESLISANMTAPEDIYTYSEQELANFNIDNTPREADDGWFDWLRGRDAPKDTSRLIDPYWNLTPYQGGLMLAGGFKIGGDRSISVTIFCRNGGAPANLLIQESRQFGIPSHSMEIRNPSVTIGRNSYSLGFRDIDFQGIDQGRAMISLNFPIDILVSGADEYLEFSPLSRHIDWPLLQVRFLMPKRELMVATFQNCISVD